MANEIASLPLERNLQILRDPIKQNHGRSLNYGRDSQHHGSEIRWHRQVALSDHEMGSVGVKSATLVPNPVFGR